MSMQQLEPNTVNFYDWEERGRGHVLYEQPIQIEPPFEPFIPAHELQSKTYLDDGRKESLVDAFKRKFLSKESLKKETKALTSYSFPDNAFLFTSTSPLHTYRISVPKGFEVPIEESERLLQMLSFSVSHFAFEIIGIGEEIFFQWSCREEDKGRLVSQLHSYFPAVAITEMNSGIPLSPGGNVAIVDMGLAEEFMRPIATVSKFSPDPLLGILAAFEELLHGELAMVQILFQGSMNAWAGQILSSVTDGTGKSFFMDAPEMPKLAHEKVSSPLYGVVVRLIAKGRNTNRTENIAYDLIRSTIAHTRTEYNMLIPLSNKEYAIEDHIESVEERKSFRLGMLLNSKELVSLVHLPSASVTSPKVSRQSIKTKVVPKDLLSGTYRLGLNEHIGRKHEVFLTDGDRLRHMHIIGSTGVGKSTLLTNLFLQDIRAGNGCVLIDPHGDTIDDVISRIPKERIADVILCDPTDTEFPVGFNLLQAETDIEKNVLSSDLVETFKARSTSWGDTMTAVLANAISAFLENDSGGTLLELRKFLIDERYRFTFLNKVNDSRVISFWQIDFPQLRKGTIAPLLTRLDTFLRPKIIRNMMAQRKGIDFNEVLRTKKILLVKLAEGLIGEDNSYLLGTLILSKLYQAAQARQAYMKTERHPFYVYIDEFHHFITPSLAAILGGARKYGFGLVLAHQELSQVMNTDANVGNSIISNPGIRVCFRLGDYDAQKLESGFQYFDRSDLQNLGVGEAIVRVGRSDFDFNIVTEALPRTKSENLSAIRSYTRTKYATPKHEIEKIIDEVLKTELKEPKKKAPVEEVKTEPEIEVAFEEIKTRKAPPKETVPPPIEDITGAQEQYIEKVEKRREIKEHRYIQEYIKKMAEQRGFKVELETKTPQGGSVDIVLRKNEEVIACEISVTNTIEYEVKNLLKCLKAGYTSIVMLCNNDTHLRNIQKEFQNSATASSHERVRFFHPDQFIEYLDTILAKETVTETRTRGYRVKTSFAPVENSEEKLRAIKDTILKSIQRE